MANQPDEVDEVMSGMDAFVSTADLFYIRLRADPRMERHLDHVDLKNLASCLCDLLAPTFGSPEWPTLYVRPALLDGCYEYFAGVMLDTLMQSKKVGALIESLVDSMMVDPRMQRVYEHIQSAAITNESEDDEHEQDKEEARLKEDEEWMEEAVLMRLQNEMQQAGVHVVQGEARDRARSSTAPARDEWDSEEVDSTRLRQIRDSYPPGEWNRGEDWHQNAARSDVYVNSALQSIEPVNVQPGVAFHGYTALAMGAWREPQFFSDFHNPGSQSHYQGECRPCSFAWSPSGCMNSAECKFCHLCPPGERQRRKRANRALKRIGVLKPKDQQSGRSDRGS